MLATIGFLITAVLLLAFAYTFYELIKKDNKELKAFAIAYSLIGIIFLMWGVLCLNSSTTALPHSVLIGDVLLLIASICSITIFTPIRLRNIVIVGSSVLAAVFVYVRAKNYYPAPVLHNGILYFNTQRPVAIMLSAIIIVAWLPACMKVAREVTSKRATRELYPVYLSIYALTIIAAALFIQAKRRSVIIESFAVFSFSILLLLLSNIIMKNSTKRKIKNASE